MPPGSDRRHDNVEVSQSVERVGQAQQVALVRKLPAHRPKCLTNGRSGRIGQLFEHELPYLGGHRKQHADFGTENAACLEV